MGLFGAKKQSAGWYAAEDPTILRYCDGQHWRGQARLTALDDFGPLPFTPEAQKQKTLKELLEQQSQIEAAVAAASAACGGLDQERAALKRQIHQLRQEHAEVVHENFLREINLRDFPTVADGSAKIAEALKDLRAQAKQLIRDGQDLSSNPPVATFFDTHSGLDSPTRKRLRKDITMMLLGIFNAEHEAATRAMRSSGSLETAVNRVLGIHQKLHTATLGIGASISPKYVDLKLKETMLVWEHLAAQAIERAEAQDAREAGGGQSPGRVRGRAGPAGERARPLPEHVGDYAAPG
ncbi:hypothetical protein ACLH0K_08940 [Arthrobacter sp. MPF02]|uniref:hypothetical protein n=1 Tax=Arthrobacter sp. MPF02 TaxID=3388492 RepID=UPI0039849F9F